MPTFGIEEEVFITEPERPTLRSLYYLARLLAKSPRYYYTHSAHNFSRGRDIWQGIMSGVEMTTGVHDCADAAVEDLAARRKDLAEVCTGLICPVGHLIDIKCPNNTCAIHIHVGGVDNKERLFTNLLYFLPVLALFTINSPYAGSSYFGQSFRMSASFAVGELVEDRTFRFQDLIISKRLQTVELRAFDPCWDLERVKWLVRCVEAIANLDDLRETDYKVYNRLRAVVAKDGLTQEILPVARELAEIIDYPQELITNTASDELKNLYEKEGLVAAYSAMDEGYRHGVFEPKEVGLKQSSNLVSGMIGFAGYFVPRFPYYAWKGFVE